MQNLLVVAALAVWAVPGFAFDEVFQRSFPLPAGGRFTLENVNGSVQVDGWEQERVEIRAVKSARENPQDLSRVEIEVQANAAAIAVRTRYPQNDGIDVRVEYRVRVPYRVLLGRVATVNGTVSVRGVEGAGELRSVNGNVELVDGAGRFSARTTNGNVRLELRRLSNDRPMSVETVNGSVVVALPANASADLDVASLNGDFRSEVPVSAPASIGSRELRGRLGRGGEVLRIRTVNGGIRVVVSQPTV